MPITKQVIKRVKQAKVRTERNRHYKSHMKSMVKLIFDYVTKNEEGKAKAILPKVIHSIDNCAKKNIIHKNNAAHKKSHVQRALNGLTSTKTAKPAAHPEKKAEVKEEASAV